MHHTVIFIGRSGCGKGTQADLLKNYIHKRDHENKQILYVETGHRFPDFLAGYMWSSELVEELGEDMHLVLDGAPRSQPEARLLTTALKFYGRENPTVIYINVGVKWAETRLLSRGRQDDKTLEKIDKRLEWFERETLPAIEYFKDNNFYNYIEVNGEQPIEKVHQDILDKYEK